MAVVNNPVVVMKRYEMKYILTPEQTQYFKESVLDHMKIDQFGLYLILFKQLIDIRDQLIIIEMHYRDVYGYRHYILSALKSLSYKPKYLIVYIVIKLCNKAISFKYWNKSIW